MANVLYIKVSAITKHSNSISESDVNQYCLIISIIHNFWWMTWIYFKRLLMKVFGLLKGIILESKCFLVKCYSSLVRTNFYILGQLPTKANLGKHSNIQNFKLIGMGEIKLEICLIISWVIKVFELPLF
jgi:hypothetical protein